MESLGFRLKDIFRSSPFQRLKGWIMLKSILYFSQIVSYCHINKLNLAEKEQNYSASYRVIDPNLLNSPLVLLYLSCSAD